MSPEEHKFPAAVCNLLKKVPGEGPPYVPTLARLLLLYLHEEMTEPESKRPHDPTGLGEEPVFEDMVLVVRVREKVGGWLPEPHRYLLEHLFPQVRSYLEHKRWVSCRYNPTEVMKIDVKYKGLGAFLRTQPKGHDEVHRLHKTLGEEAPAAASSGYMTPSDLARKHGLPLEAVKKRLGRWRKKNAAGNGYVENTNRGGKEAQYVYAEAAVVSVLDAMKAKGTCGTRTSRKGPA